MQTFRPFPNQLSAAHLTAQSFLVLRPKPQVPLAPHLLISPAPKCLPHFAFPGFVLRLGTDAPSDLHRPSGPSPP